MSFLSIILQGILGLGFIIFGFMKFSKQMVEAFNHYGYPGWFRVFTGVAELVSAALVIAGIWNEALAAWGGLLISATMLGAIFTHIKVKDTVKQMIMPFLLLILGLIVLIINFDHLLS